MSSPKPSSRLVIPPEIEAEMTPAVKAFVEFLIDHYEARIADLESQIQKLTPQNSSLPPSTQHPHAKPKRSKREGKKKKRGGQPGHKKHQRELIPTEQCNEVIPLQPDTCRKCDTPLIGMDPAPLRHQVWELPEIKPIVTEYQQHRLTCQGCATTTCAALPAGVPSGQSGPRLVAFTGLLMGHFRQSKRRDQLLRQLWERIEELAHSDPVWGGDALDLAKLVAKGRTHLQVTRTLDEEVVEYSQRVHRLRKMFPNAGSPSRTRVWLCPWRPTA